MFSDPIEIKKAAEYEKMSDADKLFLELGYKLIPPVENRCYFLKYKKDDDNIIYFDDEDKEIRKDGEYAETCYGITMQELKAINMKCKELRME